MSISEKRQQALETALAQINKKHGENSVMKLGAKPDMDIETISTGSLAIDIALGVGGLPRGRVIEIYGPESSGKTLFCLESIASAQRAGDVCAFIDAEHAFDSSWAKKVGVDVENLLITQPSSGEQGLDIAEQLVRSGAVGLIVIDSVAALTPQKELDGEIGDSTMGVQARMMSQALRKITAAVNQTKTTVIFINQLREKIGVMFGCFQYSTRVCLADGTTEKIGKLVNQKREVEVLSYNPETKRVEPRKIVNWFDNSNAERFLQFKVANGTGSGVSKFAATENHSIATPNGFEEAGSLDIGDNVLIRQMNYYSDEQIDFIKGSLIGDGSLRKRKSGTGTSFRLGHGRNQSAYLDWKLSLLDNVPYSAYENKKGAKFVDFRATPQLFPIWEEVYSPTGGKRNVKKISKDYLASLSPLSWAVYLMDDGHFDYRTEGLQERTEGGSGRISFCVDALTELSQRNLHEFLLENLGVENKLLTNSVGSTSVNLNVNGTKTFMKLVAEHVHPSMEYKLLPVYRGLFKDSGLEKIETYSTVSEAVIVDIYEKPKTRSMRKFDLEIEGNHNYFVDGVMVHNSPETTTGGKALKFYASIRLDIRRIEQLKEGTEVVGARTRIKVIKNKVAPPFTQAEFDISFMPGSEGFSREGDIIDIGVKHNIVKKGGAWYSYEGEQLGQGKEKARAHLKANPGMANEIEDKILAIVFPKVEDEVEDVTAVKAVKGSKSAKVALDDVPDSDF